MTTASEFACSFCQKRRREVEKLISGPQVFICNECVDLCQEIIEEERSKAVADGADKPGAGPLLARLDERVIGHSSAKRTLAAAVRQQHVASETALRILLVGPSGSGKTTLGRELVRAAANGFATDVGRLSESGYVGDDVEHVLCGLLDRVEGTMARAERGILFLDGVEKLSLARPLTRARDISGESVQRELLRLLDGSRAYLPKAGHARHPQVENTPMETKRILFVAAVRMEGWTLPAGASERVIRDALAEHGLLSAFIARFDRILYLPTLGTSELRDLAELMFNDAATVVKRLGVQLTISSGALDALVATAADSPDSGWALRAPIQRIVETEMLGAASVPERTVDEPEMWRAINGA